MSDIKSFELLKKRESELQIKKAKEEAKLETLNKELEGYIEQLKSLGITDLDNAESILEEKEKSLQEEYDHILSLLNQYES